ncbi:Spermatid Nuclear Transition Protein 1 [Manis pentadactyla]|nr:Spermatid Nuclear Transition Protein 1 [Manis pentadactyla]
MAKALNTPDSGPLDIAKPLILAETTMSTSRKAKSQGMRRRKSQAPHKGVKRGGTKRKYQKGSLKNRKRGGGTLLPPPPLWTLAVTLSPGARVTSLCSPDVAKTPLGVEETSLQQQSGDLDSITHMWICCAYACSFFWKNLKYGEEMQGVPDCLISSSGLFCICA